MERRLCFSKSTNWKVMKMMILQSCRFTKCWDDIFLSFYLLSLRLTCFSNLNVKLQFLFLPEGIKNCVSYFSLTARVWSALRKHKLSPSHFEMFSWKLDLVNKIAVFNLVKQGKMEITASLSMFCSRLELVLPYLCWKVFASFSLLQTELSSCYSCEDTSDWWQLEKGVYI